MLYDWAFAHRGYGVCVISGAGEVIVLEFNELVRRIADGRVAPDDYVVSSVLTDGRRVRVADMQIYELVMADRIALDRLPIRTPGGVLATGAEAERMLRAAEDNFMLGVT